MRVECGETLPASHSFFVVLIFLYWTLRVERIAVRENKCVPVHIRRRKITGV
jgi:hypothetical protein